jgi:two-component system LytT family sensor kinase
VSVVEHRRRYALWGLALIGVWSIVALLNSLQWYMGGLAAGRGPTWPQLLGYAVASNSIWVFLTPLVVAFAHRTPFRPRDGLRFSVVHLMAGVGFALLQTALYIGLMWLLGAQALGRMLVQKLSGNFQINLLIYAIIVALVVGARAYRALRDREVAGARMEARLAEAESAALRAQLQPHFLFNTLNAISALVEDEPRRARRLIAKLGDLLRLSIEEHRAPQSALGDELDFTEAYLAIEQARLGSRLRVVRDVEPDALTCLVPTLLLQPLVENAIRHGIAPLVEGGTVTIAAKVADGRLHVTVADDGKGATDIVERVGLGNARRRLRQLYGDRHSLEVVTAPRAGFRVLLVTPL